MSSEDIEKYLMEIFYGKRVEQPRKVIAHSFCKTNGWVNLIEAVPCGDPECGCCTIMSEAIDKAAKSFLEKWEESKVGPQVANYTSPDGIELLHNPQYEEE